MAKKPEDREDVAISKMGYDSRSEGYMPTIEVSHNDLCKLLGKKIQLEQLKEDVLYAKGEIDDVEGDMLKLDIKDTNRPDLWSTEGIAREIKGRLGYAGCPNYSTSKSNIEVVVDKKMKTIRPYTVCAVARNLKLDKNALSQLIQLQYKVDQTFGRNRKEVASGYYDLDKIKTPIRFTAVKPDGIKFVPLEFKEKLTPKEILEKHPKGKEYGHLLAGYKEYPIFIDANNEVLSIPPIINSDISGKIAEKTRNIFLETSGFNLKFLVPALVVMVCALADRGAKIESVKVIYSDKIDITPNLMAKKSSVDADYVNKVSGLNLSINEIVKLLRQARYNVKTKGKKIEVLYPAYRQDIMHPSDIVEDIIISYGYNNIGPKIPKLATIGKMDRMEKFSEEIAEILVGLGLQEIMSYTLTNKTNLFKKMNLKEEQVAEIENPTSLNWNVFRNHLLPSLLEFFSLNKHVDYPQHIFETGDIVMLDEKSATKSRNIRKLAAALTDTTVSYEQISSYLDACLKNLGINYKLKKVSHGTFIEGRCAEIIVDKPIGIVGEIHPKVLENWKLEKPVGAFELNIDEIFKVLNK